LEPSGVSFFEGKIQTLENERNGSQTWSWMAQMIFPVILGVIFFSVSEIDLKLYELYRKMM